MVLWEVCFDYFDADRDQGETPFIPLEMFRELLGIKSDEYPAFSIFNRAVIKPAIKEINEVTDYFVEAEHKRIGRKVSHLKFRITRVNQLPVQESFFPDIENLPPVAVELIQAEIDRKVAMKIADEDWDFVTPEKLPAPGSYTDFLGYVAEKIEISRHAAEVKNRGGFIIEAIRENYQKLRGAKGAPVASREGQGKGTSGTDRRIQNQAAEHPPSSRPRRPRTRRTRRQTHPFLHRPGTASRTRLGIGSVSERRDGDCRDQRHPCGRVLSGFVGTGC